jgi:putative nucleotidyltransferase with HDIG domain
MNNFVNNFYKNQGLFYKIFLFIITAFLIVYLLPKGGKFKYEITKGKPWQYENLYAPFNFAILKSDAEIVKEKLQINTNHTPYYTVNENIMEQVMSKVPEQLEKTFTDSILKRNRKQLSGFIENTLDDIYEYGVLLEAKPEDVNKLIYLKRGNEAFEVNYDKLLLQDEIRPFLNGQINLSNLSSLKPELLEFFYNVIKPNVTFDSTLTQKELDSKLGNISYTRGSIERGTIIISKGEIVEGETLDVLTSLKSEYESQVWSDSSYHWILFGYSLLVSLALLMLLLFIRRNRREIFENNVKVSFIFFNLLLMVFLTTLAVRFDAKYVYIVPLCILPLTLKAFFDSRLGLFTHVITVLILGFVVPNSYEYMFLQIIAGIVTILTVSELYKRANLFISVGQITFIYILVYFAFTIIQEGNIQDLNSDMFLIFILGGLATLFVQPLIYIYEKLFGLVSDMSLLELSDTNSKLLKELAEKAPGTFHHSLNVANLAEAAANEIGANAMLARVGALYHDIGKMENPTYYSENQTSSVNSHDELSPQESADVIINHVIQGIEVARKYNIPDRVIDFIRTHHGTSIVYFFYMKEKEMNENISPLDFRYPGPIPFSKETAILMMCDSVEAASKSLKEPTAAKIDDFIERIINKQMDEAQFLNANITFKEIQLVKKILKQKLKNIFHLRVEYPE